MKQKLKRNPMISIQYCRSYAEWQQALDAVEMLIDVEQSEVTVTDGNNQYFAKVTSGGNIVVSKIN